MEDFKQEIMEMHIAEKRTGDDGYRGRGRGRGDARGRGRGRGNVYQNEEERKV